MNSQTLCYQPIRQERECCVAACLQMILRRHGIEPDTQHQITTECGKLLQPGDIQRYFEKKDYPLYCYDLKVRYSFCREFDGLVRKALEQGCDIQIGYAYEELHVTDVLANHASLRFLQKKKSI